MDKEIFYTTGELADIAGITYKSIRIYVEKGLLTPDKITESGYKLFSRRSVEKLQRILMFKYLDFTLEEIGQMLEYENIQRVAGETKWSFWKLTKYALEGITAFSTTPLLISSCIGLLFCLISFLMILVIIP